MTAPDTEYAVRQWLRGLPGLVGAEVHFGIPSDVPDEFVTVERVGGAPALPLDNPRLSVHAWALTKKRAGEIARDLAEAFEGTENADIGNGVHYYGGTVDLILWQPAADTGRPRYIVDVTVSTRTI